MSNPGPNITSTSLITEPIIPQQDGYQIGASASALVGMFGATPITQPTSSAQAAVPTTPSTSTTPFGYSQVQADDLVATVNAIRLALVNLGIIKGS